MSKILYFLAAFAHTGLSVFGIRSSYEQPAYTVLQSPAPGVEVRAYAPRTVVQTEIAGGDEGQAFGRLFRYITGANAGAHRMAMTVPVEQADAPPPRLLPMTLPVETGAADAGNGAPVMRFFLPHAIAAAGAPAPTEAHVHIVTLPAATLGVIAFSGTATEAARAAALGRLRAALGKAGYAPEGEPSFLSYDPPFSIPFLRHNELALAVQAPAAPH